ncbi:MAG: hypothetical protein OXF43_00320 [Gammaproteobacteria bacterium]|nr:hypothetical protein [Gammaproteobacteria bacterium]
MTKQSFAPGSAGQKAARTRKTYTNENVGDLSHEQISVLHLARKAASSAMARAKREGIPFDHNFNLGLDELLEQQDWRCALTGIPFSGEKTSQGAGGRDYAPSPDRIDPVIGYKATNVQWILWCINRAKGRMPVRHFERVFVALGRNLHNRMSN